MVIKGPFFNTNIEYRPANFQNPANFASAATANVTGFSL